MQRMRVRSRSEVLRDTFLVLFRHGPLRITKLYRKANIGTKFRKEVLTGIEKSGFIKLMNGTGLNGRGITVKVTKKGVKWFRRWMK